MKTILLVLGIYYVVTGIWPILHMKSFMRITGFKMDQWLVRTVGLLIISSGIIFLRSSLKNEDIETAKTLALLNTGSLIFIDTYYALNKVIKKIYLTDALIELGFFIWIIWE